jgi:hypothetical protein
MQIFDDVLQSNERDLLLNLCKNANFKYGIYDVKELPFTGLDCMIDPHTFPIEILMDKIYELRPDFEHKLRPGQLTINCFAPSENPYFHIDGNEGSTAVYYPHDFYDENEGGETQLISPNDDFIYGIKPRPNRLVIFNSNVRHRATSYRTRHRFTIVIKFKK